ncbi:Hypothetical predicted protein [Octopus vulgaris]|uniref:Uncharacterized protein n=1 Tax=Octopus vulgaris TaxID=6645 RepID=A0AA36BV77_OCTVU|nr:Hypothetical predicted protein [Octopus vulgaris]
MRDLSHILDVKVAVNIGLLCILLPASPFSRLTQYCHCANLSFCCHRRMSLILVQQQMQKDMQSSVSRKPFITVMTNNFGFPF